MSPRWSVKLSPSLRIRSDVFVPSSILTKLWNIDICRCALRKTALFRHYELHSKYHYDDFPHFRKCALRVTLSSPIYYLVKFCQNENIYFQYKRVVLTYQARCQPSDTCRRFHWRQILRRSRRLLRRQYCSRTSGHRAEHGKNKALYCKQCALVNWLTYFLRQ